jgi:hypothetical protein
MNASVTSNGDRKRPLAAFGFAGGFAPRSQERSTSPGWIPTLAASNAGVVFSTTTPVGRRHGIRPSGEQGRGGPREQEADHGARSSDDSWHRGGLARSEDAPARVQGVDLDA